MKMNKPEMSLDASATHVLGSPMLSDAQTYALLRALDIGQGGFTEAEAEHVLQAAEQAAVTHNMFELAIMGLLKLSIRPSNREIVAGLVDPEAAKRALDELKQKGTV